MTLSEYRKAAGMTQSQLAKASHVPLRTIQCYEIGQRSISNASGYIILRLSMALGCKMEDLIMEDLMEVNENEQIEKEHG